MQAKVYFQSGEAKSKLALPDEIFAVKVSPDLLWQVYRVLKLRQMKPSAFTKTKGEVRGGGAKPWRQKGTGRARAGSIRSPIFTGGGVTFGPRQIKTDFSKKINQKMVRRALLGVLSRFAREDKLILVDRIELTELKTKSAVNFLVNLPIDGRILLILTVDEMSLSRAFRNIPFVEIVAAKQLNLLNLERAKFLVLSKAGVRALTERFGIKLSDIKEERPTKPESKTKRSPKIQK